MSRTLTRRPPDGPCQRCNFLDWVRQQDGDRVTWRCRACADIRRMMRHARRDTKETEGTADDTDMIIQLHAEAAHRYPSIMRAYDPGLAIQVLINDALGRGEDWT